MRARVFAALFAVVLPFSVACDSEEMDRSEMTVLRIGVLPDQSAEVLRERYTLLFEHLAGELDIPYEFVTPETYVELVEQFDSGRIDLANFGGLTFLKVQATGNAVPLVMRDVDTKLTSYFLVRADSVATEIEDFEGKTVSFGSRLSTSGHLMPRQFLLKRGIKPEDFFGEVRYSGAHDTTAYDVRDGRADLGVANTHVIKSMFADGRLDQDDVRVLWQTPPYPDYVWAIHSTVGLSLRRRIRDAFLELSAIDDGHARILERLGAGAFLPVGAADFQQLRKIAKSTGLLGEG